MDDTIRRYGILIAPPGTEFSYSNLGYGILERIIERVSGKSYADFVLSEVLVPLGMTRSAVVRTRNLVLTETATASACYRPNPCALS